MRNTTLLCCYKITKSVSQKNGCFFFKKNRKNSFFSSACSCTSAFTACQQHSACQTVYTEPEEPTLGDDVIICHLCGNRDPNNMFKTMFLRERLEGICIFLPLQSRISLKHSRNLEEFQCKGQGSKPKLDPRDL